jgi:chromosome segregation ATPase
MIINLSYIPQRYFTIAMKKNLKALYRFLPKKSGGEIELSLTEAGFGKPYPELDKKLEDTAAEMTTFEKEKEDITDKQDEKDSRELRRETLREQLKHHQDAIENIKSEIAALEKDERKMNPMCKWNLRQQRQKRVG